MDPTINLNDGSPAMTQVVEPVVSRLKPDPFETDVMVYILTRLEQEHPHLFTDEGGALADLFVKPMATLLEPIRREFSSVSKQLSLADPDQLTSVEADKLMANFFMTRNPGGYARVKVRIYFQNPLSVNIGTTNVAYTSSGLRFLPTQAQSINAEEMLFNLDSSGLYYFDVHFQAERPGTAYNIVAGDIAGVTGLSASTRATNLSKAAPGVREETTSEFIDRGESSMGERSITSFPGMVAALRGEFANLSIVQAIGFNDEEMHRDVIAGGSLGPVLQSGLDGITHDDGDADGWTTYFEVDSGSVDFTTAFGPVGTDLSGYSLEVWYNDGVAVSPHEYTLKQVEGASLVSISDEYDGSAALPDGIVTSLTGTWTIRTRGNITLSDIPGGILFPDVLSGEGLTVPDNEIHVGGCADVYVRGGDIEEASVALTLVADEEVIARREDAQTDTTGAAVSHGNVILNDLTEEEWDRIVEGRTSLVLEEGTDEGAYRIVQKLSGGPPYTVRLGQSMQAAGVVTDISYLLVDDVDINLLEPREIRYEGVNLRTVAGLAIVETVSGTPIFASVGVVEGDYVHILSGDDAGEYQIVPGGVLGNQLTLDTIMTTSSSPLAFEIYRKQDGIKLPLLRVKTVEVLDSNLDPTGSFVPYRHPVDIQSTSFQNPGREAKAATSLSITNGTYLFRGSALGEEDEVQLVDGAGAPTGVDLYATLGVRPGDIVNINTSDNQGYYTVVAVGTVGGLSSVDKMQLDRDLRWPTVVLSDLMDYAVGPPSYGSCRFYFLDPVTVEMTYADTLLAVELGTTSLNFRPDPDVWDEYLPSETTVAVVAFTSADALGHLYTYPDDTTATGGVGVPPYLDLAAYGYVAGDRVEITYAPLVGSENVGTGGPYNLDGATILIDVGNGNEVVTFSGTSLDADTIVSQINAQLSKDVAAKYEDPAAAGDFYLMLRADHEITIRDNSGAANDATATLFGVNRQMWNPWLPADAFAAQETDNESPEKGFYYTGGTPSLTSPITLEELDGSGSHVIGTYPGGSIDPTLGHYAHFDRQGRQRISSTAMADQVDENGLYYVDVECISEGYGNLWNIADGLQMTATGYRAEGWEITTEDEDTSYSMAEVPWLGISPRILVSGSEDDPFERQEIAGRSIQVVYERDPIVEQVHEFVRDPHNRVLCMNPLARSLLPIFVRTYIEYRSGGTEAEVREDIAELIESILPEQMLEVDDIADVVRRTGATKVTHPVTLLGIGHQRNRSIVTERSVDQISSGRLSALIPDDDGTTSEGASRISLLRTI